MVNPIYILIVMLAGVFLIPIFDKMSRKVSIIISGLIMAAVTVIPGIWLWNMTVTGTQIDVTIYTAGSKPPFSIALYMGMVESILLTLVNFTGILTIMYNSGKIIRSSKYFLMLIVTLFIGINGIILTRDIFNLFVFVEIMSLSSAAIIYSGKDKRSYSAGFQYMVASGITSIVLLLGIILYYYASGSLSLESISFANGIRMFNAQKIFAGAIVFILGALFVELKPFPANGWGLSVYESSDSGTGALFSSVITTASLYAFHKVLPFTRLLSFISLNTVNLIFILAIVSFIVMNLIALRQKTANRLLGYSSIAQVNLITAVIVFLFSINADIHLFIKVAGGLFINHFLAKSGLFWISGIIKEKRINDWTNLRKHPDLLIFFVIFILALIGLPPFPGFWSKWELFNLMMKNLNPVYCFAIGLGVLLESYYMLKWMGKVLVRKTDSAVPENRNTDHGILQVIPVIAVVFLLFLTGIVQNPIKRINLITFAPVFFLMTFFTLDWLNAKIKAILLIGSVSGYSWMLYKLFALEFDNLRFIFLVMFFAASMLFVLASMNRKGSEKGFYPFLAMMISSLIILVFAQRTLQFFVQWEFITISSYFLVIYNRKTEAAALKYIMFSLGSAVLMLIGFSFTGRFIPDNTYLVSFMRIPDKGLLTYILLSIAFLIKSGACGVHIWLPDAYTRSDDIISTFFSSVLSKLGIYGFFLFSILMGPVIMQNEILMQTLSYIGILTAFTGTFLAVFQENYKKLLAYSSMGQIGYILLSISMFSEIGWVSALYLTILHLVFKGLVFLAVSGVHLRTNTLSMYKTGGLIKKMPLTFISVLIGIIAISGVPPLAGFGSKWLLYTGLLEKGWYIQAGAAFFTSTIAFLYLFRLIHTIFLGQAKTEHKNVKEAPVWYIIPQYILIGVIMLFSMFPATLIKPVQNAVSDFFGSSLIWDGNVLRNAFASWNGNLVMNITMGVFGFVFIVLLLATRKIQKVGQFNIVYAAERPYKPETTHYAYNFFPFYRKAFAPLMNSSIVKFWEFIYDLNHTLASGLKYIFSGNAQVYALQVVLYIIAIFFLSGVMNV